MISKEKVLLISKYEDRILGLIDDQLRDDEDSLTQSDLQGAITVIVMDILNERVA